jgi:hypothetical protein
MSPGVPSGGAPQIVTCLSKSPAKQAPSEFPQRSQLRR